MEPEGILHRSRGQNYSIPTAKGQTHVTQGTLIPSAKSSGSSPKHSRSPNSSPLLKGSLDRSLVFEPVVEDGIPESLVEEGVEQGVEQVVEGLEGVGQVIGGVEPVVEEGVEAEVESIHVANAASPGKNEVVENPTDGQPDGLFFHDGFLSFTSRDCLVIPLDLLAKFAGAAKKFDLSFNRLVNVKGLERFGELEELMLDNNDLTDDVNFPNLPKLATLSINKNKIVDLDRFVSMCRWKFPALSFLSLVGNECCPNLVLANDGDDDEDDDYQRYRYAVIFKIPTLKFLDFTPVSETERKEALRRGKFLSTVKVDEKAIENLLASQSSSEGGGGGSAANSKAKGRKKLSEEPIKDYSPLPPAVRGGGGGGVGGGGAGVGGNGVDSTTKEAYGKCRYVYYGKQSEGNRFIANDTL